MGIMNVLLIIITVLGAFLPIVLLGHKRKKILSKPKQDTIKDYLKIYKEKIEKYQLVEIDSQIKVDEPQTMSQSMAIVVTIFTIIFIYVFKFIIRENFFIGFFIVVFYVFGGLIIFLLTKKPKIKKILLKNNVIELYDSNDEIKTYQLDLTNVKYNIKIYRESSARRSHKYINIYFNNDKYTTKEFTVYDYESYIAFIIFVNLLKRNELEKINNLNNDDIKGLQQNFIYNEKLEY